jgi:hypothetical protein
MHILMIFLDGIGLGDDDPLVNPFAAASLPTLTALTNGKRWVRGIGVQESERALFIPTDPRMGMPGRPQSATGQATIITGRNVPQAVGEHYGPRPNPAVRAVLAEDNFFKQVVGHGKRAALISAYPARLHDAINSGKRLRSSYQQALHEAGLPMFGEAELYSGEGLSEDWTGHGWREHLGYTDTPLYPPEEAGRRIVEVSRRYDFAFFSHWMSDTVGHRGTVEDGARLLEVFDSVMAGMLEAWDDAEGVLIVTSDHGNMEDLSHGKHTENDVPTLVIGDARDVFRDVHDLSDLVPRMGRLLFAES